MTRWDEVAATTRAWFDVAIEGDTWLGVVWEGARIKVASVELLGRSFVMIIGDALDASDLDPRTVLELNRALSIGAFEVEGQRLMLRATLPIAGLDDVDLRRVILHVCRQVAHVQGKVRAPASPNGPAAFLHYAD